MSRTKDSDQSWSEVGWILEIKGARKIKNSSMEDWEQRPPYKPEHCL